VNISLMREFLCLAEQLNFTKAAGNLFVSQPVLSRHIAGLEKKLGVQLFVRDKQSVELTGAGEVVRTELAAVVARYDEAIRKIRQAVTGMAGELRIGFLDRAVKSFLPKLITRFRAAYPNIDLHLNQYNIGALSQAIKRQEVEFAFTLSFGHMESPGYGSKPLYTDCLAVAMRNDHPLAGLKEIPISLLAHEPFIVAEREESGMLNRVLEICAVGGFSPHIVKYYTFPENALLLARTGIGVAIVSRHMEPHADPALCFSDIKGGNTGFDVIAIWKTTNSNPAIRLFLNELEAIAAEPAMKPVAKPR
jgi:DNA-binding transcriptional LysR family regulator